MKRNETNPHRCGGCSVDDRLLALEDLTGKPFRELFGECEGRDGRV